jgi:hypothetical protein
MLAAAAKAHAAVEAETVAAKAAADKEAMEAAAATEAAAEWADVDNAKKALALAEKQLATASAANKAVVRQTVDECKADLARAQAEAEESEANADREQREAEVRRLPHMRRASAGEARREIFSSPSAAPAGDPRSGAPSSARQARTAGTSTSRSPCPPAVASTGSARSRPGSRHRQSWCGAEQLPSRQHTPRQSARQRRTSHKHTPLQFALKPHQVLGGEGNCASGDDLAAAIFAKVREIGLNLN